MTGAVRRRLIAFVVLSALGVFYASANYLGIVDAVLGRGYSVTADLPGTGGLYKGSLVTYRGVQIGQVSSMSPRADGVSVHLDLEDGASVPEDSPMYVHNGSAVGEQYLDFEPASDEGPYLGEGDVIQAGKGTLPVDEGDLLVDIDEFVQSVDKRDLSTVVDELGKMFYGTGRPLQHLIDGGNTLVDTAAANKQETIALLEQGRTVLRTQQASAGSIRDFADGMAQLTGTLRTSDDDLRAIVEGGPSTFGEVQKLMEGLEPTFPILLSNLVTVNEVTALRLPNLEQLLVTYPVIIASGFTGTTDDGYGHVHLEYTKDPPPCRDGYLPPSKWRPADDLSDAPVYLKAHCDSPPPYAVRGANYVPKPGDGSRRVAPYDVRTGTVMGSGQQAGAGRPGGRRRLREGRLEVDAGRPDRPAVREVGRRSPRRGAVLPVLLLLVLLDLPVLAAAGVWAWQHHERGQAEDARAADRAALTAATRQTLAWASVDWRKADEYVATVEKGATGDFLSQFQESEPALRKLLRTNKSVQVPSIPKDGAGLLERDGDQAKVLIAMDASVTNKSAKKPQPRQYRLQVTMVRQGGTWLTSGLEFIDAGS